MCIREVMLIRVERQEHLPFGYIGGNNISRYVSCQSSEKCPLSNYAT